MSTKRSFFVGTPQACPYHTSTDICIHPGAPKSKDYKCLKCPGDSGESTFPGLCPLPKINEEYTPRLVLIQSPASCPFRDEPSLCIPVEEVHICHHKDVMTTDILSGHMYCRDDKNFHQFCPLWSDKVTIK